MTTNRRASARLESQGLMTNIFDGRSAVLGVVDDVSRRGMRVSAIPASSTESMESCYAIVNGAWQDFHLALRLRWIRAVPSGKYQIIGFQIQDPPAEWTRYIERMENEQGGGKFFAA